MTSPRISAAPPYQTIVFDCDSTLSRIEGIEELARELASDWSPRIQELTRAAMAGEIPLEEVYGQRLKSMRPSAASMARVLGLIISRSLVNAVSRLRDAAEKIGAGRLDVRVGRGGGVEFERLGDAFNKMAGDLQSSQDTLE